MELTKVEETIRKELMEAWHVKGMMTFSNQDSTLIDVKIELLERLADEILEERNIDIREFLNLTDSK